MFTNRKIIKLLGNWKLKWDLDFKWYHCTHFEISHIVWNCSIIYCRLIESQWKKNPSSTGNKSQASLTYEKLQYIYIEIIQNTLFWCIHTFFLYKTKLNWSSQFLEKGEWSVINIPDMQDFLFSWDFAEETCSWKGFF